MLNQQTYVILSLQTHLFHARQTKEHAIFIEASLPQNEQLLLLEVQEYHKKLENLLGWTVHNGIRLMPPELLEAQDLVTPYTLQCEEKTSHYTGIGIDMEITREQQQPKSISNPVITQAMAEHMRFINNAAIKLLDNFIIYQEELKKSISECRLYMHMYVSMLKHLIEEAKWYRKALMDIEQGIDIRLWDPMMISRFWTEIQRDHAAFIRGLLDPAQTEEFALAQEYLRQFNELLKQLKQSEFPDPQMAKQLLGEMEEFQLFNVTAVQAIGSCQLKSIILPLLADHVLREANHFLRILKTQPNH